MKKPIWYMTRIFVSRVPCLDHVFKKEFLKLLQPLRVCKGIYLFCMNLLEVSMMFWYLQSLYIPYLVPIQGCPIDMRD